MIITAGTTRIAIGKITPLSGESRRDAERRTVEKIVAGMIGPEYIVAHRPDGSPYIQGSDIHISISHSRLMAAVALDPARPVGVDIEESRPEQLSRVATRYLTDVELEQYRDDLLRAWTRKEARYKYLTSASYTTDAAAPTADLRLISIPDTAFSLDTVLESTGTTHRLVLATS